MKRVKRVIFWIAVAWAYDCFGSEYIPPTLSAEYIDRVAPTAGPWYGPDDSLESLNAGWCGGKSDRMIAIMKDGLLGEQSPFASTLSGTEKYITRICDALYRSGDSPEITNTLHQALLITKNLYRDIILHAYIMASPVPMTVLAETVVKGFPAGQRRAWYTAAGEKALHRDSREDSLIDRPSREALRYSHFLNRVKALETDPECLRAIGNPVDPGRETFPLSGAGSGEGVWDGRAAPNGAARFIARVAPTARPGHEPDDSLRSVNAGLGRGRDGGMVGLIGEELLSRGTPLARTSDGTPEYVAELLGTLWRSGDSPEITNILHRALLAPTNHYREATVRAYVMASPVPMTALAETVVKEVPPEERKAWYLRSKTLRTNDRITRSIDRPSREVLRYSHFLNRVKALESDPECLRVIGSPVDPKRE